MIHSPRLQTGSFQVDIQLLKDSAMGVTNRIFVAQAPNAIAMFDRDMRYLEFSEKWIEEYGLQGKTLTGVSHYDIFPEIGDDWKKIHRECLAGSVNKTDEALFIRADGSEQWITWEVRPWYDENRAIGGIIMVTADITQRKNLERERRAEQLLLRTVVDNIPLNVYAKDLESRKTLVNKTEMEYLGVLDESDILGKNDYDMYPPESAAISVEEDRMIFETGEAIINRETFNMKNDGTFAWFLTSKIPLRRDNGDIYGLVGLSHNITDRKEAEESAKKISILESKSKEMEQFAYVASHDLREPLLTIKNYVELLVEDFGDSIPEEGQIYTQAINRAVGRMEELINGLLDYSRLSQVKQIKVVNANEILQQVEADLNAQITSTNTKIEYKDLPTLKAYPLELKLLFQNLITNAIKFRRKDTDPVIEISARQIRGGWKFEVRDNGIGIEESDRQKIFVIFQRLHSKSEYPGTGIGLAHCKKIVELHNGLIGVDSIPGKSSNFHFTILTDSL